MSIDKNFSELYTFSEATKMYGLTDGSTLRKAVQNFNPLSPCGERHYAIPCF